MSSSVYELVRGGGYASRCFAVVAVAHTHFATHRSLDATVRGDEFRQLLARTVRTRPPPTLLTRPARTRKALVSKNESAGQAGKRHTRSAPVLRRVSEIAVGGNLDRLMDDDADDEFDDGRQS